MLLVFYLQICVQTKILAYSRAVIPLQAFRNILFKFPTPACLIALHQTSMCSVAGLHQLRWSIPIPLSGLRLMTALLMEGIRLAMVILFGLNTQTRLCTA